MLKGFTAELRRIGLILCIALIVGVAVDHITLALLLGSTIYIINHFLQLHKLHSWTTRSDQPPPESTGLWGELFDSLYQLQRHQKLEKEQLQAVIKRIQEITSALKDGIIILDWRGHLDFWNPAAHRMLALNTKDQGQSVINFIRHPKFVSYFEERNYSEPLEIPSPRFPSKYLQFQITPFGNNERLIVVRDTTQLHNLEKMRQDFVANVSHELRTPLTVINGYVETLADNNTTPAWDKPLQQMLQQAKRMSLLINDLLVLSKLETTEAGHNHKAINVEQLLQVVKSEADVLSSEKSQTLTLICNNTTKPLTLQGNEKELHSAFSNLVTNAIKYTQAEGKISILLWQDKNHFYVSVSDNGPGIEAKHLPRLTERFYRVDASRNSGTGGTGLGLAIVKHVLMRHDAELKITSEVGKGSVFMCVFPLPQ
ncbi:phosphate regulon sensor histidine kinase PhoR [Cellvibrio japonicus]|uniref:Phosphate regulon sensor protein PhoR n=1 Tax=Cellvibrio japonicus (strain Ueda107) TaxID=498211 RepID=B3PG94_CELJU|nr:phosphate regulon sensor histidine kinase PhoR [Cellvibrio japonicus]ACE84230.1 phosphate regulon sensor protein PhoR [Cellvibrio japonicus Ueda107]QEI10897.1 phosphate regulon sensor histidine kinase PhoR [Cellvibrio japonicus]QEI14473.1 phosphate regulon sensor histidine kinase PhoR [Cellvibrio japonicus]QEI18051.1 phosphate regulon sensor histidine kinase PhoR [Cellvibrio japonicus]